MIFLQALVSFILTILKCLLLFIIKPYYYFSLNSLNYYVNFKNLIIMMP
jgi:hypothetical protein